MLLANFRANLLDLARAAAAELAAHFPGAAVVIDETTPRRALCAVPGRPHTATHGLLCETHLQELGTWLRDIETEANRLDAAPSMQTRLGQGGGGSLASHQTPVVLDAVVYRDRRTTAHGHRRIGPVCPACPTLAGRRCTCPPLDFRRRVHWAGCPQHGIHPSCLNILADVDEYDANAQRLLSVYAVLHELAQRVRDERIIGIETRRIADKIPGVAVCTDLHCPRCRELRWYRDVPVPLTIATERDVLSRQLGWIAEQPWVAAMRSQLAELRAQLLRHNRNEDDRPLSGYCYRVVDGQECGGRLLPAAPVHSIGPDTDTEDDPQRPRAVVCERDTSHRWEGRDLARLSVILEQQRRADRLAAMPPPAPSARPQLRIVSTAGQGSRLDPLLAEQRLTEGDPA